MPQKPRVIYWIRTDLRLHDSPALKAALDLEPEAFWPVWTWDPHYVYRARVGVNRWQFLIDCQNDLSTSLTSLNPKQKLFLLRESPQTLFPKLFRAWKPTHLVFELDTDAYARSRDSIIIAAAKEAGVKVITKTGRTLWDIDELVKKNGGKPTMSITQLQKAGQKVGAIPRPIPPPTSLPNPGSLELDFKREVPISLPDINAPSRQSLDSSYTHIAGPKGDFAIPTLKELGFPEATTPHRGGETLALASLRTHLQNKDFVAKFEKPKTAPTDFAPQATTLLSPHLHFGSLSIREFYWGVVDVVAEWEKKKGKGKASQLPVNLVGQLLFREMYIAAYAAIGAPFSTMRGNPYCRFIPWELASPHPASSSSSSPLPNTITNAKTLPTQAETEAAHHLHLFLTARTGFPTIDALMTQLITTGWIHHLGRHLVACFLTRGGCYISWERGAEIFAEYLLDHEEACNVGNWQWLSCSAFYAQYFKVYSPVAFLKGFGEQKAVDFVKEYLPELRGLDKKYIFEPHKAPLSDLKKAGIKLGGDGPGSYPRPMFDFAERRRFCLEGMKEAYKGGLYGDDESVRVIDEIGNWVVGKGHGNDKVKPLKGSEDIVEEHGEEAAEEGGESKGGDRDMDMEMEIDQRPEDTKAVPRRPKRKATSTAIPPPTIPTPRPKPNAGGQATLDGHFKRAKK